jgi:hypothetical protein
MDHFKGLIATLASYVTGLAIPFLDPGSPDFITWFLQNTAFIVTIIIGCFSLIKSWTWLKDRQKNEKKDTIEKD